MKICINAGHTKFGPGTGAVGTLNESIETRHIAFELMRQLADSGHEIIPAIFDRSENNLNEAVTVANTHSVDLFVSIHFNAGGGQGSEIYTWKGVANSKTNNLLHNLSAIGFKNRGVKDGSKLYVIKNTKMPSMLVEVCFVDNVYDAKLYKELGHTKIANAIYKAII